MSQQKSLDIPEPALRDSNSIEMIRVWIAENKLQSIIRVGMYDDMKMSEEVVWGKILMDLVFHIADALVLDERSNDFSASVESIISSLLREKNSPTTPRSGDFV